MLVCGEHVEDVMEQIVYDEERAPELLTLEQADVSGEAVCETCGEPAAYCVR